MPRRQPARRFGQAKPDVPRWRRGNAAPAPQIRLSRKQERAYIERLTAAQHGPLATPTAPKGVNHALASTGAYRFRYQLVPFAWLAGMLALGLGSHAAHGPWQGTVLGLIASGLILILTRHTKGFARKAGQAVAALTAVWVPALSLLGPVKPLLPLLLACWVCVLIPWVRHYRIRHEEPAAPVIVKTTDYETWAKLAAKRKWAGHLGTPEDIPGGGRRYPIVLDGSETDIGEVMAQPRKIAAAWGKAITEAYVEPSPDGIESRGSLTLLKRGTLSEPREWDGTGINEDTGLAVVARFPDGQPVHERFFIRRYGVRHTVVAGADGSGKSGLLDLGLCMSAVSGYITPVILDPQEGQALPAWPGHVPYACGVDECIVYLRALHAAMLDRSKYLAGFRWTTDEGHERKGMGFFDPFMTGLPIVEITVDETPALTTGHKRAEEAVWLLGDIGKRGRKAGFRLRVAVQVPSLAELGAQAFRSMLVGGNVFGLRAGDRVSGGMIGISVDPSDLPKYFADGSPTTGLGYASGVDNRPGTPMRTLWVPDVYKISESARIRPMDDRCAAVMERAIAGTATAVPLPSASPLAAVPPPEEDETAPGGRTAADAILAVLDEADGPLERGDIILRTKPLVTTGWGRAKPFSVKAQGNALAKLTQDRKIQKTEHGTYAPVRASLHVVSGSDHAESEATGA